jgi:AraC-like DNA-binding protein
MNGRAIHEGRLVTGSFHVTPPQGRMKCTFRGAYDAMHLFVPNRIIEKKAEEILGHRTAVWSDCPQQDPAIAHLARSLLLSAQEGCRDLRDQIAMAIVTRLLISTRRPAGDTAHDGGGLPRWRLQRVTDYIEANLDQPLSLAEIAAVSGLSRMHFAAQFRKSTGQRPHQYVLDRRVERAQEILATTNLPIVQVALSVGFQAQSHFTTIFKRVVGQPPHAWRRDQAVPVPRAQ